jgi:hypothetical protein
MAFERRYHRCCNRYRHRRSGRTGQRGSTGIRARCRAVPDGHRHRRIRPLRRLGNRRSLRKRIHDLRWCHTRRLDRRIESRSSEGRSGRGNPRRECNSVRTRRPCRGRIPCGTPRAGDRCNRFPPSSPFGWIHDKSPRRCSRFPARRCRRRRQKLSWRRPRRRNGIAYSHCRRARSRAGTGRSHRPRPAGRRTRTRHSSRGPSKSPEATCTRRSMARSLPGRRRHRPGRCVGAPVRSRSRPTSELRGIGSAAVRSASGTTDMTVDPRGRLQAAQETTSLAPTLHPPLPLSRALRGRRTSFATAGSTLVLPSRSAAARSLQARLTAVGRPAGGRWALGRGARGRR